MELNLSIVKLKLLSPLLLEGYDSHGRSFFRSFDELSVEKFQNNYQLLLSPLGVYVKGLKGNASHLIPYARIESLEVRELPNESSDAVQAAAETQAHKHIAEALTGGEASSVRPVQEGSGLRGNRRK